MGTLTSCFTKSSAISFFLSNISLFYPQKSCVILLYEVNPPNAAYPVFLCFKIQQEFAMHDMHLVYAELLLFMQKELLDSET
jgi:hypothetical protein